MVVNLVGGIHRQVVDGISLTVKEALKLGSTRLTDRFPIDACKVDIRAKRDLLSLPAVAAVVHGISKAKQGLDRADVLVVVGFLNAVDIDLSRVARRAEGCLVTKGAVVEVSRAPDIGVTVVAVMKERAVIKGHACKVARKGVEAAEGAVVKGEVGTVGLIDVEAVCAAACKGAIPCPSSDVIIPASTSPLPPTAIPGLPVVLR